MISSVYFIQGIGSPQKTSTKQDIVNIINIRHTQLSWVKLARPVTWGRPNEQDFGQCPKETVQGTLLGLLFIMPLCASLHHKNN